MEMKLSDQIQLFLTEAKHIGSHKFALLRALLDYIIEKNPHDDKDLEIPLIYLAEKVLTYYWVMYLNDVKQKSTLGRFLFYEYLDNIVQELKLEDAAGGELAENHIHVLWELINNTEKLSRNLITALNRTRINIFKGPVKHSQYITIAQKPTVLDIYSYPESTPGRIEAGTYREFYENETITLKVKKEYLKDFKKMYYWYEQAIITGWARYTDQFSENRKKTSHTGLTLLEIPEPSRGNLNIFRKHFRQALDVVNCAYCHKKPFQAVDHIIPWKMVKIDQFWNMLPICTSCNSSKSDRIWSLDGKAKKILKNSIAAIVANLDENPDFRNQVISHFYHTRQTQPKDMKALSDYLYKVTLNRVDDFLGAVD